MAGKAWPGQGREALVSKEPRGLLTAQASAHSYARALTGRTPDLLDLAFLIA
jgi:hypothetical protein